MGTAIKDPVSDRVKPSFVIFDIRAPGILLVGSFTCKNRLPYNLYCVGGDVKHCTIQSNPEHQSAWMSKITNDGLTRSDTGSFIAVPIWQQCA